MFSSMDIYVHQRKIRSTETKGRERINETDLGVMLQLTFYNKDKNTLYVGQKVIIHITINTHKGSTENNLNPSKEDKD